LVQQAAPWPATVRFDKEFHVDSGPWTLDLMDVATLHAR
jgi:hypothetical protein